MCFPPFTGYLYTLPSMSLAPLHAHLTATGNLLLALFVRLGNLATTWNLAACAGILFLLACGFYSAPILFVIYMPIHLVVGAGMALHRPTRRGLYWKSGSRSSGGPSTRYSEATISTTGARRTSEVCGRSIVAFGRPGESGLTGIRAVGRSPDASMGNFSMRTRCSGRTSLSPGPER